MVQLCYLLQVSVQLVHFEMCTLCSWCCSAMILYERIGSFSGNSTWVDVSPRWARNTLSRHKNVSIATYTGHGYVYTDLLEQNLLHFFNKQC